jgi:predicted transcriptional regulator
MVDKGKRDIAKNVVKLLPVLKEIEKGDGLSQSEIRDRTGYSKSTGHRRVKRASESGFIERETQGYTLTELGEVVVGLCSEYLSELERAYEYEEFLGTIRDSDLSLSDIDGCEVTRSSPTNPVAPFVRLAEVTANSSDVRVVTNAIAPESFDVGRDRVREGSLEVEMVVDGRTVDSIRSSDWFGEELRRDLRTGNFDLWVHEGRVPYQIGLMDGKLCLGAEDENRMPVALLETENEEAVGWAEDVFERYREGSEPLTASDV